MSSIKHETENEITVLTEVASVNSSATLENLHEDDKVVAEQADDIASKIIKMLVSLWIILE